MSESQPTAVPEQPTRSRRPLLNFLRQRLEGWRLRHRLPINFALHMIGIPMVFSSLILIFFFPWYWAVAAFVVGYLLQWIGHRFEGNDLGELAAIKRQLGLPYVGISPRWNPEDPDRL